VPIERRRALDEGAPQMLEVRYTFEGHELQAGTLVQTRELIFDHHAPLTVRQARKPYRCDDPRCGQRIDKGDLQGTDGYGAVHYCLDCVVAR
jgi:hypothetical protein